MSDQEVRDVTGREWGDEAFHPDGSLGRRVWECECCGEVVQEPLLAWLKRVLRQMLT